MKQLTVAVILAFAAFASAGNNETEAEIGGSSLLALVSGRDNHSAEILRTGEFSSALLALALLDARDNQSAASAGNTNSSLLNTRSFAELRIGSSPEPETHGRPVLAGCRQGRCTGDSVSLVSAITGNTTEDAENSTVHTTIEGDIFSMGVRVGNFSVSRDVSSQTTIESLSAQFQVGPFSALSMNGTLLLNISQSLAELGFGDDCSVTLHFHEEPSLARRYLQEQRIMFTDLGGQWWINAVALTQVFSAKMDVIRKHLHALTVAKYNLNELPVGLHENFSLLMHAISKCKPDVVRAILIEMNNTSGNIFRKICAENVRVSSEIGKFLIRNADDFEGREHIWKCVRGFVDMVESETKPEKLKATAADAVATVVAPVRMLGSILRKWGGNKG